MNDDLVAGYRIANGNLTSEVQQLRARVKKAEQSAAFWRESWEKIVDDLGECIRRVQKRSRGKRFATVLELKMLLTDQGNDARKEHEDP